MTNSFPLLGFAACRLHPGMSFSVISFVSISKFPNLHGPLMGPFGVLAFLLSFATVLSSKVLYSDIQKPPD
jgi:hypothetical protein